MKVILAGGTGFIGNALLDELIAQGEEVTLLTRRSHMVEKQPGLKVAVWDAKTMGSWAKDVEGSDVVINLAGRPLSLQRLSREAKKEVIDSRVYSTKILVEAMRDCRRPPKTFICASAVGYYGHVPEGDCDEETAPGEGFLAEVCKAWENEAKQAATLGIRTIMMRLGVVLAKDGGALAKMMNAFMMYVGAIPGSGRQWVSWVHRRDVIRASRFVLNTNDLQGPVNLAAPQPVTMAEMCASLGKLLRRPVWGHIPAPLIRTALGEMSEMVLNGQRAIPQKLLRAGFAFDYPDFLTALRAIVGQTSDHYGVP